MKCGLGNAATIQEGKEKAAICGTKVEMAERPLRDVKLAANIIFFLISKFKRNTYDSRKPRRVNQDCYRL
jgi:hypothetical protein